MPVVNLRLDFRELREQISHLSEGVMDDSHVSNLLLTVIQSVWSTNRSFQIDYRGAFCRAGGQHRDWIISDGTLQRKIVAATDQWLRTAVAIQGIDPTNRLMQTNVNMQTKLLDLRLIVINQEAVLHDV